MPWSGIGGVEIATLRMTAATADRFHNIAFCLKSAVELQTRFERLGVETISYTPPEPSLRHFFAYFNASRKIARELKRIKADIVHFSDETAAYHNSFAALLSGTRNICHLRVTYSQLDLHRRLCLMPVHHFIFVSQEAMDNFAISLPAGKARVIYDAVQIPPDEVSLARKKVRAEFGIPEETPVIAMVARVSPQKDHITLAEAALEVLKKHPEARFLVVGDNSQVVNNRIHYAKVAAKLSGLGIADKFIFTGQRQDVPEMISAADICVLCTHREGFPLSILECMAMKKPVVATDVGGIPEIIRNGVNGHLHRHEDSDELAAILIMLLDDQEKTRQMGVAAREHVRSNYALPKYVEEMSEAYEYVMR